MKPVTELLGDGSLELSAANGTDIPYKGWMEIEVTLSKDAVAGMSDNPVLVPILVATSDHPEEQSDGHTVWSAKQECGERIKCSVRAKP